MTYKELTANYNKLQKASQLAVEENDFLKRAVTKILTGSIWAFIKARRSYKKGMKEMKAKNDNK